MTRAEWLESVAGALVLGALGYVLFIVFFVIL